MNWKILLCVAILAAGCRNEALERDLAKPSKQETPAEPASSPEPLLVVEPEPEPEPEPPPPTIYDVSCYDHGTKIFQGRAAIEEGGELSMSFRTDSGKHVWLSGDSRTCVWESR